MMPPSAATPGGVSPWWRSVLGLNEAQSDAGPLKYPHIIDKTRRLECRKLYGEWGLVWGDCHLTGRLTLLGNNRGNHEFYIVLFIWDGEKSTAKHSKYNTSKTNVKIPLL